MQDGDTVWIVQHDAGPTNTVLGVFRTADEAQTFAEHPHLQREYGDNIVYSSFPVGYRYWDKWSRYEDLPALPWKTPFDRGRRGAEDGEPASGETSPTVDRRENRQTPR